MKFPSSLQLVLEKIRISNTKDWIKDHAELLKEKIESMNEFQTPLAYASSVILMLFSYIVEEREDAVQAMKMGGSLFSLEQEWLFGLQEALCLAWQEVAESEKERFTSEFWPKQKSDFESMVLSKLQSKPIRSWNLENPEFEVDENLFGRVDDAFSEWYSPPLLDWEEKHLIGTFRQQELKWGENLGYGICLGTVYHWIKTLLAMDPKKKITKEILQALRVFPGKDIKESNELKINPQEQEKSHIERSALQDVRFASAQAHIEHRLGGSRSKRKPRIPDQLLKRDGLKSTSEENSLVFSEDVEGILKELREHGAMHDKGSYDSEYYRSEGLYAIMAGRADGSGGHVLGIQADFRNQRFLFMDPNRGIYSFDTFDELSEKVSQLLEHVYRGRYNSFFTTQYFRSPI